LWSVVSVTEFGWIWLAHMLTGIVLLPLALRWPARDGALVIVAGLYLATAALQGHGLPGSGLTRIAGGFEAVLHMAAAAAWLGSLVPLWFISLAAAEGDGINAADALRRYAPWGTAAVCLLVPAGLVLIITIEGGLVWTASDYEWLIAIKFLLVGLMLSLAAYNRFILRPRLFAGQVPGAAGQMRLSIIAEITLGLAVVGLVAILGLLDPPQAGG
jgi:putative copper export protein